MAHASMKNVGTALIVAGVLAVFTILVLVSHQTMVRGCSISNLDLKISLKELTLGTKMPCPDRSDVQPALNGRRSWQFGSMLMLCSLPIALPYKANGHTTTEEAITKQVTGQAPPAPPELIPPDLRAASQSDLNVAVASMHLAYLMTLQSLEVAETGVENSCRFENNQKTFRTYRFTVTGRSVEHGQRCATTTARGEGVVGMPIEEIKGGKYCRDASGQWWPAN